MAGFKKGSLRPLTPIPWRLLENRRKAIDDEENFMLLEGISA